MSKVKKCEFCGKFMHYEDDLIPEDDDLDIDLLHAAGLDEDDEDFDPFEEPYVRFHYIQNYWECESCGIYITDVDGPKHYYNPDIGFVGSYDESYKPKTLKEQALEQLKAQEEAGQLRLL